MKVIVVETGEYDSYIFGVYLSKETAVENIKAEYKEPCIVRWEQEEDCLYGYFEAVVGYSTKHTKRFDFTEYDVV